MNFMIKLLQGCIICCFLWPLWKSAKHFSSKALIFSLVGIFYVLDKL